MPDLDPSQDDRNRHARVLEDALEIYVERSKERGQLWKDFDPEDAALHIKSKSARVLAIEARGQDAEDDALDLINYAVFYIRHKRAVGLPKEEK